MRWGLALICVAGCGGGTGVDLEIRSEVPIESVEIFVANRPCTTGMDEQTPCREAIGWLDGQLPVAGSIYEMHNEEFDKQKLELRLTPEASSDGSTYTVRLVAEGEIGETAMIAIVGLDSTRTARSLAVIDTQIPENSAERWVVTLQAVDVATAEDAAPTDIYRRAAVWGRDGSPEQQAGSRCLVMQQWTGSDWKSKFIVPASDHDCDGVVRNLECDDQYYHLNAQRPATCVTQPPSCGTGGGACTVGVSTCRDGTSSNATGCLIPAVGAAQVCVPDKICELCDGPYGVVPCAQAAVRNISDVSHARCRLYGSASDGSACGLGGSGSVAKLVLPFTECSSFEVRPLAMPLVQSQSTRFMLQAGSFRISPTNNCSLDISFESGTIENGTEEWILLGVYPRAAEQTVMLIPIKIEFAGGGTDCAGGLVPEVCSASSLESDNIKSCGL